MNTMTILNRLGVPAALLASAALLVLVLAVPSKAVAQHTVYAPVPMTTMYPAPAGPPTPTPCISCHQPEPWMPDPVMQCLVGTNNIDCSSATTVKFSDLIQIITTAPNGASGTFQLAGNVPTTPTGFTASSSTGTVTLSYPPGYNQTVSSLYLTSAQSDTSNGTEYATSLTEYDVETGVSPEIIITANVSCTSPIRKTDGEGQTYVQNQPIVFSVPDGTPPFAADIYLDGQTIVLGLQNFMGSTPVTCSMAGTAQDTTGLTCRVDTLPSTYSAGFPYFPSVGQNNSYVVPLSSFRWTSPGVASQFTDQRPASWSNPGQ